MKNTSAYGNKRIGFDPKAVLIAVHSLYIEVLRRKLGKRFTRIDKEFGQWTFLGTEYEGATIQTFCANLEAQLIEAIKQSAETPTGFPVMANQFKFSKN